MMYKYNVKTISDFLTCMYTSYFPLMFLFNGISNFVGYSMPKNSCGIIQHIVGGYRGSYLSQGY